MVAHGIHRTVLVAMLSAVALGAAGGAALHAGMASGIGGACAAAAGLVLLWPVAWMVTFRIVRPLKHLATVAGELQGGKLQRRADLPDATGEVGEVAGALRALSDRLAKQLAEQRALMAAVSHELRSPLGRMRVLVEMAEEGSAPPTLHADLEGEIAGMDALVGDLLASSRIELEALAPRPLDPLDVARRAVEIARVDAAIEGAAPTVHADATLLARAVATMLDNARRYGGRRIVLRVSDEGGSVRFEVADDGPGFAPGDEERAFEPFWRGPSADAPRGEGLGLALVRRIAVAHGGSAGAATRPEGGALVWIELPPTG